MKKLLYVVIAIVAVGIIAAVGYRIYLGILAGDGQISREVQAERSFAVDSEDASDGVAVDADDAAVDADEESATGAVQYGVTSGDGGDSRAQFLIREVIFGRENMVEGTTRQIDGSFLIDYDSNSVQVGQFEINVRDIRTRSLDVDMSERERWSDGERDVVIRAEILQSGRDEFEFATFNPTDVSGVPESFGVGDTLDIVLTGDLTIRGVTSGVDFDMELTLESDEIIRGTAATTVLWDDFGIDIPYVGGDSDVNSVDDSVELRLEFTAVREERSGLDGGG